MVWVLFIIAAPSEEPQGLEVTPAMHKQPRLAVGCVSVSRCRESETFSSH